MDTQIQPTHAQKPETQEGQTSKSVIFVSPHFDDICFSLGNLLPKMRIPNKHLINIFTRSDDVSNDAILAKLKGFKGEERIDTISHMRDQEDDSYMRQFHVDKINLDFVDADIVAGTEDNPGEHYEGMGQEAELVTARIAPLLRKMVEKEPGTAIFCPLAIGEHRNHLVAFKAVVATASTLPTDIPIIFYEELPYAATPWKREARLLELDSFLKERGYVRQHFDISSEELARKSASARKYLSQMSPSNEHFAIKTKECPQPHEALWIKGGLDFGNFLR